MCKISNIQYGENTWSILDGSSVSLGTYKIQDTRYKIQDTRYKIQDTRYKIHDTRYNIYPH